MKTILATAGLCLGTLFLGAAPSSANEAATLAGVRSEAGYVTTQGRGFRRGGGRTVFVGPRRRNNVGRNVAIGVGAAIIGGIVASEAARASSGGGGNSCRRWSYQCNDGSRWACRNLNRYC